MFRRILVGWDGSHGAGDALRVALDLAMALHGEVIAVAVIQEQPHTETTRESALRAARDAVAREIDEFRVEADRFGVVLSHRDLVVPADANAGEAIVKEAARHAFDLIVVGRHGTSQALHPHLGPVADHLVRNSICPVLVVGGGSPRT